MPNPRRIYGEEDSESEHEGSFFAGAEPPSAPSQETAHTDISSLTGATTLPSSNTSTATPPSGTDRSPPTQPHQQLPPVQERWSPSPSPVSPVVPDAPRGSLDNASDHVKQQQQQSPGAPLPALQSEPSIMRNWDRRANEVFEGPLDGVDAPPHQAPQPPDETTDDNHNMDHYGNSNNKEDGRPYLENNHQSYRSLDGNHRASIVPNIAVLAILAAGVIVGVLVALLAVNDGELGGGSDNQGPPEYTLPTIGSTRVECETSADCVSALDTGSRCLDGRCTNPFYESGCFRYLHKDWNKGQRRPRVCHSEDGDQARQAGFCRTPDDGLEYKEVRILSQNWESPIVVAWMWQIILTEVLGVPATLETGLPDTSIDFYHPSLKADYGTSNDLTALEASVEIAGGTQGCGPITEQNKKLGELAQYQACAHAIPEVWPTQHLRLAKLREEKPHVAEAPVGLGVIGQQSWFIPLWTAKRNPSLAHYEGLAGEANRATLADTFKRPTTWKDYCDEVSITKCVEPDAYASRRPSDADEEVMYYHGWDTFKGYFRKTEENDCVNNTKCTGHFADYPAGWSSYVEQQAYHLNIALRSSGPEKGCRGYPYARLVEVVKAANATQSDVMFFWWSPEALYSKFSRTDFEFQRVSLPPPTQECVDAAVTSEERCDENEAVRIGKPEGVCMEPPSTLQKFVAQSLLTISQDPSAPGALQSPAYDLIKDFTITSLQLGEVLDRWLARGDNSAFDLRYATCEWLVENWEDIESDLIPENFPRIIKEEEDKMDAFSVVTLVLSLLAMVAVLITSALAYIQRERPVIRNAQVGFLFILLVGLFSVTVGNILSALPPTDALCGLTIWLVNVGYTLELVPLIVKIAGILTLLSAARQMKRVVLDMRHLYAMVIGITSIVVFFLLAWSLVDIPVKETFFTLSSVTAPDGSKVITQEHYCSSDSDFWNYFAALWFFILLLAASVLAVQTRHLKTDYNETETLAVLIYSHSVFVILRILTFTMSSEDEADAVRFRSVIISCDVLAALAIYFVTKFVSSDRADGPGREREPTADPRVESTKEIPPPVEEYCDDNGPPAVGLNSVTTGNSISMGLSTADRIRRCELDLDLEPEGYSSIIERVATLEVQLFNNVQEGGLKPRLDNLERELFE